MRNGQNKRMRGRNRRGHNPLTRVYESNGPDVKIRGTAHHIAEKYLQLARDAQSSGDPVSAEGYMQHAEHYFRLIAAAQAQFSQQNPQHPNAQQPFTRSDMDARDDFDDESDDAGAGEQPSMPFPANAQPATQRPQPQPNFQGHPQVREHEEQQGGSLPAFITGGANPGAQQGNGHDSEQGERSERGDRFGRRRRRFRPRGGSDQEQRAEGASEISAGDASPELHSAEADVAPKAGE